MESLEVKIERDIIQKALENFKEKMSCKMLSKMERGWRGWDDEKFESNIRKSLTKHIMRFLNGDDNEYVDIANLCMMLDRFQDSKKP